MAYYAFLDENNVVTEVIAGIDETELIEGIDPETWYGNFRGQVCKRTSYNLNIRKNYASIGYTYNENLDAFIPPMPSTTIPDFENEGQTKEVTWVLNEDTCGWDIVE
jgi:hypothetical protein